MKEKNFENIEKKVIKWFLEKNAPIHLKGFKYIRYILTKRLIEDWDEEHIGLQYLKTGKYFGTTEYIVERNIRHFIEKSNEKQTNSEYLAKIFYLIKIEE